MLGREIQVLIRGDEKALVLGRLAENAGCISKTEVTKIRIEADDDRFDVAIDLKVNIKEETRQLIF